jgi:large subunit ribosomal protein L18
MIKKINKSITRDRRHKRLRKKIEGTAERPRLSVYRSLKHFHLQLIDDTNGKTLLGLSTQSESLKSSSKNLCSVEGAKIIGKEFAKLALEKNFNSVVFDRGGLGYHGKIKALAETLREAGLKF